MVLSLYANHSILSNRCSFGRSISVPYCPEAEIPNWVHCCHDPYPYGAPNFPEPHFDLEFYATLPWVLDEAKNS